MIRKRLGYHRVDVDLAPFMAADWGPGHVEAVAATLERFPALRQALEHREAVRAEVEAWRADVPEALRGDLLARLDHIHDDLARFVETLNGGATVRADQLLSMRNHIAGEMQRFGALELPARCAAACPGLAEALAAYKDAGPRLMQAMDTVLQSGNGTLSRGQRQAAAAAIAAELEP